MGTPSKANAAKAELRRTIVEARRQILPADRRERSRRIAATCARLPACAAAEIICSYVDFREEVETREFIASLLTAGRRVAVPVHLHGEPRPLVFAEIRSLSELVPNHLGILQPAHETARFLPTNTIPLFFVPGVAFDLTGHRLGYGLGFYDRAFAAAAAGTLKVGLAFEPQLLEKLPADPHDVPMDLVVTEDRVLPAPPATGHPTRRW